MKSFFLLLSFLACTLFSAAQSARPVLADKPDPSKKTDTLEVACGMCQMELKGADCALAARVNNKAYYVEGTHIDSHGDAHAKDGFCNMIRKAAVQGTLVENKYKVTYFKLLPVSATP